MPFTPHERKMLVKSKRLTHRMVAEAVGVDTSEVTHIMAGRRLNGRMARKVMQYIVEQTGHTIGDLFPEIETRESDPPVVAKAA